MLRLTIVSAALLVARAAALITASVYASAGVSVATSPSLGRTILTDDSGVTLYRYTEDQGSTSVCYDACAAAWPPVLVDALPVVQDSNLAQNLGLTQRRDGSQQLTYQNQPLYYFVGDTKPGDANGQGADGFWFVLDGPTS